MIISFAYHIAHSQAYKFTSSKRSIVHKSGLDYTKIVIVSEVNSHYIDTKTAVADRDEYKETVRNINQITRDANKFVDDYVNHRKGIVILHKAEFLRRYRYSTLRYFHRELCL